MSSDKGNKKSNTGTKMATIAVNAGRKFSDERENSAPIFLNSSYVFEDAAYGQAVFAGEVDGNIYSRFTNPSVTAFEERMAAMEGGERALATASGMSAISTVFLALLSAGDHLVISRSVFGSTLNVAHGVLEKLGIEVTPVALSDLNAWKAAIRPNTKMLFVETPANPTLEMVDLTALSALSKENGLTLVVDNVFCTPCLQQPLALGADIVVQSATKFIDGQGRVLGGAIIGAESLLMDDIFPFIRNTGPTLSSFNAWVLYKSLETLPLRMERHCSNAMKVAHFLDEHPRTRGKVHFPGLSHHPQHELAKKQMTGFGALVCVIFDTIQEAHVFIDALEMATITANLGDVRTLVTHPATTTHSRLSSEQREAAGVYDGLVRFSIGIEDAEDILADLDQALKQLG
ncbi:MAG: O-succinylhomoserine sulfhydrylase [Magnetococcales bacterium]|nr:O-succinylhomoserine sulfhydrylase [Magnetococcales bacterium]